MVGIIDNTVFNIESKKLREYLRTRNLSVVEMQVIMQVELDCSKSQTTKNVIDKMNDTRLM